MEKFVCDLNEDAATIAGHPKKIRALSMAVELLEGDDSPKRLEVFE